MDTLGQIRVPARIDQLYGCIGFVSDCARRAGFGAERIQDIELALEEAVVNVFHYAYGGGEGDVSILCRSDGESMEIDIQDQGFAFDALSRQDPEIREDVSERPIGGLGIFFIKRLMDDVRYRRENDSNILTLVASRHGAAESGNGS